MKTIVKQLSQKSGLEYLHIDDNLDFAYYQDKDDFYLLCFYDYHDLLRLTGDNLKVLEYALNTVVANAKTSEVLARFTDRNINYNLSLILFVDLDNDYPNLIQELNKVEENYIIAKKYVLHYDSTTLGQLRVKIADSDNIIQSINDLAIVHSDSIQDNEEKWYDLLLNLFIKIPYLNYQPTDHSLTITNLSDSINGVLTDRESFLLSIINTGNISSITDIENFANIKNMIE